MQVNLAAQVLCHSVAIVILALVTLKHLPDSSKDTGQFVEHFDDLFNTFNSQTVKTSQRLGQRRRFFGPSNIDNGQLC